MILIVRYNTNAVHLLNVIYLFTDTYKAHSP